MATTGNSDPVTTFSVSIEGDLSIRQVLDDQPYIFGQRVIASESCTAKGKSDLLIEELEGSHCAQCPLTVGCLIHESAEILRRGPLTYINSVHCD